ncbi:MAG TPA: hypothetical protein VK179_18080 [Bacteroidales bacterium]|nr:hypothetical protein [Bacteroidales bacterium]
MEKTNLHRIMRNLHRDIGYLILGFVVIFSLSGIVLVYRNTGFMKHKVTVERNLKSNLTNEELGRELRMRDFKVEREEGTKIIFDNGSYDSKTGLAIYEAEELVFPFERLTKLHKKNGNDGAHWFTAAFGILLFFMAVSSFWMFKAGTKNFKRGLILAGIGIVIAIFVLFI